MKVKAGQETAKKTYLVEAAVLSKSPIPGPLSYFSGEKIAPGTLVKVPVKSKLVPALILSSKDARSAKSAIRRAGFALKKIRKSDVLKASLEPAVLRALGETARYYASSVGALLSALVPRLVAAEPELFLPLKDGAAPGRKKKPGLSAPRETFLLQMEGEERFGQYRALVRQCFARETSVMLVVPTHLDAERAQAELSTGIAEFVHVFTLEGKRSEARRAWTEALTEKHPVLFVTTPSGLLFSRPDLETVIIERENSRAYRTLVRPYLDMKFFIQTLTRQSGRQLVLGDSVLSLETLWREKKGEYGETSLIRWRLPVAPARLVDASSKQNESGRFEIFSPELKSFITGALAKNEKVFLFGARKGLAPTTVCGDCGAVLPCLNCGAPVVLHRRDEANVYVCHACGNARDATTVCGQCKSWKLVPLGIGTEEIYRQARTLFPGHNVEVLDKDHAPTDAKAARVAQRFKARGGILVGTELAFFHLDAVPYSGLVSVDALFSVPDFCINERIFYLVSRLREMTRVETIIQTRNIGRQVLAWAAQGNIADFYQGEISERETLRYPPFSIFIKIITPKKDAIRETERIREEFLRWHPDVFRNSVVMRVPRESWPDAELVERLSLLGPEFSIKVDPESIL